MQFSRDRGGKRQLADTRPNAVPDRGARGRRVAEEAIRAALTRAARVCWTQCPAAWQGQISGTRGAPERPGFTPRHSGPAAKRAGRAADKRTPLVIRDAHAVHGHRALQGRMRAGDLPALRGAGTDAARGAGVRLELDRPRPADLLAADADRRPFALHDLGEGLERPLR